MQIVPAQLKQAGHRLLHGVVVIVTHLHLAIFEGAVTGLALSEKQIRPGVARGLQPRLDFGLGACAWQRRYFLSGTRLQRPKLGQ